MGWVSEWKIRFLQACRAGSKTLTAKNAAGKAKTPDAAAQKGKTGEVEPGEAEAGEALLDWLERIKAEGRLSDAAAAAVASFREQVARVKAEGGETAALAEQAKALWATLRQAGLSEEVRKAAAKLRVRGK